MLVFVFLVFFGFSLLPINHSCTSTSQLFSCSELLYCDEKQDYICSFCSADEHCRFYNSDFYCRYSERFEGNICVYEPILHKFSSKKIISTSLICILGIIATIAGIDGGCFTIPILVSLAGIPMNYVSSLSSSILCGGSLAICLINVFKKHSFYQRPLINYNVAGIFEPISWVGTVFGVALCSIIPNWIFFSLQLLFLLIYSVFLLVKGIRQINVRSVYSEAELVSFPSSYIGPSYSKRLLMVFLHSWVVFQFFPFLRGGDRSQSIALIKQCSLSYWLVSFLPLLLYVSLNVYFISCLKEYPVLGQTANSKNSHFIYLFISSFFSGIFSGLLGFNGEIIKGSLLATLGLNVEEIRATRELMMFMTSSSVSIQYIANGMLNYKDFFILLGVGFVPSIIGHLIFKFFKNKLQKPGPYTIATAILCFVGTGAVGYCRNADIADAIKNHTYIRFHDFCMIE